MLVIIIYWKKSGRTYIINKIHNKCIVKELTYLSMDGFMACLNFNCRAEHPRVNKIVSFPTKTVLKKLSAK